LRLLQRGEEFLEFIDKEKRENQRVIFIPGVISIGIDTVLILYQHGTGSE